MKKKPPVVLVDIYRDKKREWRWRVRAKNGNILADSGEGYKRRTDAVRGVWRTHQAIESLRND